jgi:hypothetical protein
MSIRLLEGISQINIKTIENKVVNFAAESYLCSEFTLDENGKINGGTISVSGGFFTIGKEQAVKWATELVRLNSGIDIYCLEDCL